MKALIYTAILYGVTSPVMIAVILHIGNNKKIMNNFTNSQFSNILGGITLIVMTVARFYCYIFNLNSYYI